MNEIALVLNEFSQFVFKAVTANSQYKITDFHKDCTQLEKLFDKLLARCES